MKNTENLGEFQKFIDNDNKTGLCLEDTLRFFDKQCIFKQRERLETCQLVPRQSFTRLVFFKDTKQHLQLGKCHGNNFDSQIGAATLSMIQ